MSCVFYTPVLFLFFFFLFFFFVPCHPASRKPILFVIPPL